MTITDQIYLIDETYSLPSAYGQCIRFFFVGLERVSDVFPTPILQELKHAHDYWISDRSEYDLTVGKKLVWSFMTEATGSLPPRTESALRAALFVFEAKPPSPDLFEVLTWFTDYLAGAGVDNDDVRRALEACFPADGL